MSMALCNNILQEKVNAGFAGKELKKGGHRTPPAAGGYAIHFARARKHEEWKFGPPACISRKADVTVEAVPRKNLKPWKHSISRDSLDTAATVSSLAPAFP
jgi:hypothetical protein